MYTCIKSKFTWITPHLRRMVDLIESIGSPKGLWINLKEPKVHKRQISDWMAWIRVETHGEAHINKKFKNRGWMDVFLASLNWALVGTNPHNPHTPKVANKSLDDGGVLLSRQ